MMNNLAQLLALALVVVAGTLPLPAGACAIVSKEEAARRQLEALAKMKTDLLALKEEADLVFVGRLAKLTWHEETVDSGSGMPQVMRVHQALFDFADEIKGSYPAGQALEFTTNRSRVMIGCGSDLGQNMPKEKDAGDAHLVYAKAGKILRVNRIPDFQLMNGRQEVDFLRSAQHPR